MGVTKTRVLMPHVQYRKAYLALSNLRNAHVAMLN